MKFWHRKVTSLRQQEILEAVRNTSWQRFRLSLKGLSTEDKLIALEGYCERREREGSISRTDQVRVDNYINALLRGGQLVRTHNNTIQVQR